MDTPRRAAKLALFVALASFAALAPLAHAQLDGDKPYAGSTHAVPSIQDTETPAQRDARMAWWRAARFGMFIHWGLYSVPAGSWNGKSTPSIGEWIMNDLSIPVADYKSIAPRLNPVGFSAHDIVALAKSSGMKYIIITSKHHDGFAMFDSATNPFNIVAATPFKRDPLRELADEARKQGIKLGFYYSQDQDWTAPGGSALRRGDHQPPTFHWDHAQDGDFDTYLHTKAIPQIKELLTNYGPDVPAVLWFDTPNKMTPAEAAEIVTLLNQHPNLIWNNRLGGGYTGDTETPEQFVPPNGFPGRDWESCMTMNDTWGYKTDDLDFKSTETLLRNLIDIASKGGNYLLNIGPDGDGNVPPAELERLHAMGRWLAVNGAAIYGTTATLFDTPTTMPDPIKKDKKGEPKLISTWNWRSTTTPEKVYVEIITWPTVTGDSAQLHLGKLPRKVTGAYLLADTAHKHLHFAQSSTGIDVTLPSKPLDPIATVLVLTTKDQVRLPEGLR